MTAELVAMSTPDAAADGPAERASWLRWPSRLEPVALLAVAPLLWYPRPNSYWLLAAVPAFWALRWAARGRPLARTAIDTPALAFLLLLPLSLVNATDWGLAYPRLLGILVGLALVYALAGWPRSAREAVWLGAVFGAVVALASTAAGTLGTAWELNEQKLFQLGDLYARLPRAIAAVSLPRGGINPNETAGAIVFFVPLLAALAFGLARSGWRGARLLQLGLVVVLAAVVALLLLTQSRGGMFGAVAGLSVVALWLLALRPGRAWLAAGLGLVATLAMSAGLLLTLVSSSSGISDARSTFAARNEIWFRALYMVQDSPWFGVGLGQFQRVIFSDYASYALTPDARLGAGSSGAAMPPDLAGFNRFIPHAHNFFLQDAADLGLAGLAAIVALLIAWAGALWRASRRTDEPAARALAAGLVGGMAGFLAFGLNDTIVLGARGGLAFWVVLGLGLALAGAVRPTAERARSARTGRLGRVLSFAAVLVAAVPLVVMVAVGAAAPCGAGSAGGSPIGWADRLGDAVAYPANAAVAEIVALRGCAPEAVALRWTDASAHARLASQMARVDAALAAQGDRLGSRARLADELSAAAGAGADPWTVCAVERLRGRFCRPA